MEINIRGCNNYGSASWKDVTVKEDGTTINFSVNVGEELKRFRETLLDAAFGDMNMDEIIAYLTENGYSDEIIERYEDEKSEAA